MPYLFDVDHKTIAISALAATTSLAIFSSYKWWQSDKALKLQEKDNVYETVRYLNEYLQFHYGQSSEILQWNFGPTSALEFPKRCAELCIKHFDDKPASKTIRAIDVGCAVGRSTFELARRFDEVIGVDYSKSFVDTCNLLRDNGKLGYTVLKQGTIMEEFVAIVSQDIDRNKAKFIRGDAYNLPLDIGQFDCVLAANLTDRNKAKFIRGDACNLPLDIGQFDCVLAANLVDRLHTPQSFLDRLSSLVASGGILVITTPYTFLTEYTPRKNWIGGWVTENGKEYSGLDGLRDQLGSRFELVDTQDMPFLIRETVRKFQWTVAQASVWRRRN